MWRFIGILCGLAVLISTIGCIVADVNLLNLL